jgi:hypothetical protein
MSRVVNTTTGSSVFINDIGISINHGEPYTIHPNNYGRFAASVDIDNLLDAGDLTLTLFTTLLTPVDAKRVINELSPFIAAYDSNQNLLQPVVRYIEVDGVFLALENLGDGQSRLKSNLTATSQGRLVAFTFENSGNTANKWLAFGASSATSNEVPFVCPFNCSISAITFANDDDDESSDIDIYKNGNLLYTWEVRNKRTAYKSDFNGLSVSIGDRVSIFMKKHQGKAPSNPVVETILKISDNTTGEGGTQNGV